MGADYRIRREKDELPDLMRLLGMVGEPPAEALKYGGEAFAALMAEYPPKREGSEYIRTGTLGRGWRGYVDSFRYRVRNDVTYSTFVQGANRRWFHKETGWKTPREVYAARGEAIRGALRRGVFKSWQKVKL